MPSPQRDTDQDGTSEDKYVQNIAAMDDARLVIAVGEHESVNWGLEVGYAFGKGQPVVLLTQSEHFIPVMSLGMYAEIVRADDLDRIEAYIETLERACRRSIAALEDAPVPAATREGV